MTTQELLNLNAILNKFSNHCKNVVNGSEEIEEKDQIILHLSENCLRDILKNCGWLSECEIVLVDEPVLKNINRVPIMISVYASELTDEDVKFLTERGLRPADLASLQTTMIMFQGTYMSAVMEAIAEELISPECCMYQLYAYQKNGASSEIRRVVVE